MGPLPEYFLPYLAIGLLACSRGAIARSARSSQWSGPRRFSGQRAGLYRRRPALYYLLPFLRRRLSTAETLKTLYIYIRVCRINVKGILSRDVSFSPCHRFEVLSAPRRPKTESPRRPLPVVLLWILMIIVGGGGRSDLIWVPKVKMEEEGIGRVMKMGE